MADSLRDRVIAACIAKPGSVEDYPFGDEVAVLGYHLNKRHWNTVTLDGSVPEDELLDLIGHSYELVVASLSRAERDTLNS